MSKYKKSRRPKIKRYRRSFYTPAMRAKNAVGIAVLVLAVLGAAWLAAPYVLDWATHTWYTVVRDRDLSPEPAPAPASSEAVDAPASSASQPEAPSELPAVTEPEPEPVDGTAIVEGRWAEVPVSDLTDAAAIRAAAKKLAEQGVTYALVELKDSSGSVYYASSVPAASGSTASPTVDPEQIVAVFRENGLVPVARIAAFRDPVAAYADRSMAIHYQSQDGSDYLWLDAASAAAGGKPWLNPYAESAVQFVGDLVEELYSMGFEQVVLRYVQFPSTVSKKQDFGSGASGSRQDRLAADIAGWQQRFEGRVVLWLEYPLGSCTETVSALGAPAAQLGMQNLLVDVPAASTMDEARSEELRQSLLAQGVEHVVLRDDTAARFE
ncbi:MAG: putative glycoside hydrolase [Faecalibacterium sp.]